jgi:hypothetical protein
MVCFPKEVFSNLFFKAIGPYLAQDIELKID